jgi:hypothetical protein
MELGRRRERGRKKEEEGRRDIDGHLEGSIFPLDTY